jgi:hypothetical protein
MRFGISFGSSSGFSFNASHGNNRGLGNYNNPPPLRPSATYFEPPTGSFLPKTFVPSPSPVPKVTPPVDTAAVTKKLQSDMYSLAFSGCSAALTKPTVVYGSAWGNADADYYGKLVAAGRRPEACSYMENRLRDEKAVKTATPTVPSAPPRPASAIAFDKIWYTVWTEEKGKHYSDLIKAGRREEAGNYIGKYTHDVGAQVAKSASLALTKPTVVYGSAWGNADADYYGKLVAADRRPEACSYMENRLRDEKAVKTATPTVAPAIIVPPVVVPSSSSSSSYTNNNHERSSSCSSSAVVSSGSSSGGSSSSSSSSQQLASTTSSSSSSLASLAADVAALSYSKQVPLPTHPDCVVPKDYVDNAKTAATIMSFMFSALNDADPIEATLKGLAAPLKVGELIEERQRECTNLNAIRSIENRTAELTELTKEVEQTENTRKRPRSASPRPS